LDNEVTLILALNSCNINPVEKSQLLGLVRQPVKAIVLLFPLSEALETKMREEDARIAKDGQHPIDPTIIWIKQTVRLLALI
jgi:Ubiquitin carboxyl-terminal hydrolase, family 1